MAVLDNGQPGQFTQTLSYFREASIGEGGAEPAEDPESTIEEQLAIAKIHRTRAETARQKIVNELMEAAKDLYQKLVREGEQTLEKAKQRDAQSELNHLEAQRELERAQSVKAEANAYQEKTIAQAQQQAQAILDQAQAIKAEAVAFREKLLTEVQQQTQEELNLAQAARVEADAYREKVLAQTQQQAQEILRQAQLAAEQEGAEIRRKHSIEAEKRLAQAEITEASAQEQPEAQKRHAEATTPETGPKEALKQDRAKPGHRDSPSSERLNPKDLSSLLQGPASVTDLPQNSSPKTSEDFSSKQRPSKNELVVGLELDGCAKAYPVQMAAGHKVINDTVAGQDVIVVFGAPAEPGIIFRRCVEGRSLTFVTLPEADNGLMLMKDQETGTTWEALTGRAISGALATKELQRLTSEYSFWFAWSELHPDTEIYAKH